MDAIDIVREQVKAYEAHRNYAVITITHSDGSTPRKNGKMLVYEDGSTTGTIGGGAVELMAIRDAKECIKNGSGKVRAYDLTSAASETGMTCGGNISVLIEVFAVRPLLVVCGAGHVGEAVVKLASFLGFDTLLLDDREEQEITEKIKAADRFIRIRNYEEELKRMELPENSYVVIATHGHAFDGAALAGVLRKNVAYIGMIGSVKKKHALYRNMLEQGFSEEELQKVYAPIGLNLGGETPEEIALSIMAEIMTIKYDRNAAHLREIKK